MKAFLRFFVLLALLTAGAPSVHAAGEQSVHAAGEQTLSELTVLSADGRTHRFTVEEAKDPRTREIGLMFRDSLAPDSGMLFDFGTPRPVAMWMKNTLIPLDMLFMANDGRIISIAQRTVPLSLTPIGPPEPARAVLEIGGGVAERLGIVPGDRVRHPIFGGSTP